MPLDSSSIEPRTISVANNRLTLLPDGPKRLERLIALIDGAERTLRLLYYIFLDDAAGMRVRDALLRAVERGVAVSLLVDGFGSDAADEEFFKPLVDGDCHFCRFVPRWGRRYLMRNHQKLALADERKVIVGGFNVSDDYFGTVAAGAWRDLGLEVEGSSVDCLADYFDSIFAWAQRPKATLRELRKMLSQHSDEDGQLHWLFGGPTRRLSPWARKVKTDMMRARRLDMIAAYFGPSRGLLRRIYRIAKRGEVRIVTAGKSDNSATIAASRHTYWRLLKRGAKVYEYEATKLHSKLFIIDDVVHIGSANFDMRSLYINLEMMLRIDDAAFAAEMRRFFESELEGSREITRESHARERTWWRRLVWAAAHFVTATMDYNVSRRLNFGIDGR